MANDDVLFGWPPLPPLRPWQQHSAPSVHYSATSQDAAQSLAPRHRNLQNIVLEAISRAPNGLSDREIADVTGLSENTARPRRIELHEKGFVESWGKRKTRSGRWAQVWTAVRKAGDDESSS